MILKVEGNNVIAMANEEEIIIFQVAESLTSVQIEKAIDRLTSLQKFQIVVENAKAELKNAVTPAPKKRAPRKKARVETSEEATPEAQEPATDPSTGYTWING